jgi:hypothetical protein
MCKGLLGRPSQARPVARPSRTQPVAPVGDAPAPEPPPAPDDGGDRTMRTTALLVGGILVLAVGAVSIARARHRSRSARAPVGTATPTAAQAPARAAPTPTFKGAARLPWSRGTDDNVEGVPPTVTNAANWYEGHDGYRNAKRDAESAHAPMLVYFRAGSCEDCPRFESDVLAHATLQPLIDGAIKVRVDASTGPNEKVLANSFAATEYPSLYLVPRPAAQPQKVPGLARVGTQPINVKPETLADALRRMGLPGARGAIVAGARRALSGDYGDARKELTRALEMDPGSTEALYWRAWAAIRDADAKRAIDDLRLAITLDPTWLFSYTELARAYGQGDRLDEAIKTLDQLVAAAPGWNQSAGLVMRAEMYTRKGDSTRAAADLKQACQAGNAQACRPARP